MDTQISSVGVAYTDGASLRRMWWKHSWYAVALLLLLAPPFALWSLDPAIAKTLFFDAPHHRWLASKSWLAATLIHQCGRDLIRLIATAAILLWAASYYSARLRLHRRALAYFALAIVLGTGIVGALKVVTNVDCPWDLALFTGTRPYLHVFQARPASLPHAQCFPAAHAASGYALLSLYFVFRERSRRRALLGLGVGALTGLVFGIAQQARGAHFLSHDIWSLCLVWLTCVTLYVFGFRAQLYGEGRNTSPLAKAARDSGCTQTIGNSV